MPLWIKIFGWIFMLLGLGGPVAAIVLAVLHEPGTFDILGLHHEGPPFEPMGVAILAILLSLGVSAYGLLRGKPWGCSACLATGYGAVAICLGTMVYSVAEGALVVRLELLVLAPYLRKLHKIRPLWNGDAATPKGSASLPQA